jgi:hypothetical protein
MISLLKSEATNPAPSPAAGFKKRKAGHLVAIINDDGSTSGQESLDISIRAAAIKRLGKNDKVCKKRARYP